VNNWKETTLGEVVTFQRGHDLPVSEFKAGDYLVMGSNGPIGKHSDFTTKGPGITIGRSGNIGNVFFVKEDFWAHNTTLYSKEFHNSDPKYVYFLVKNLRFEQFNTGSAVPTLNRNLIHPIIVIVPPLPEQKAIAAILSGFDDKIELLRMQNKTLEQIAQTIFKEWFVKFKVKGEKLKINSKTGLPEGWRMGRIYEFLEVDYGYPFQSSMFNEEKNGLPLIRIRDLKDGSPDVYTNEPYQESYIVNPGDIVAGMDAEFRPCIWKGKKGLLNQRVCRFRPKNGVGHVFVLETMRPYLNFYEKTKFGTTVSHLGKSDLDSIEAIIPERNLIERFSNSTEPLFRKIILNNSQIQTLSRLRDVLLPKLMKGEMRVKL